MRTFYKASCNRTMAFFLILLNLLPHGVLAQSDTTIYFHEILEWDESVSSIAWSPDGQKIAIGSNEDANVIRIWGFSNGGSEITNVELLYTLRGSEEAIDSIKWSPDGQKIASIDWGHVRIWDTSTGHEQIRIDTIATSVSWSPDNMQLATSEVGINIWDATTGEHLDFLNVPEEEQPKDVVWWISSVEYSPDGTRLASARPDGRIWDLNNGTSAIITNCFGYDGYLVAWSPDGNRIASHDGICDSATGEQEVSFRFGSALAWSPDGSKVAGANSYNVSILDAETGNTLGLLEGTQNTVFSLVWSPDSSKIASIEAGGILRLWGISTNLDNQN